MRKRLMMFNLPLWLVLGLWIVLGVTGTPAFAATRAQLRGQVKKLQTAYLNKTWQSVSDQARRLLQDPSLKQYPKLRASVLLYLGGMLYEQKLKSLAKAAFAQALRLNSVLKLPAGSSAGLSAFYNKALRDHKQERSYFSGKPAVRKVTTPKGRGTARWHAGWIIGLPVAVVGLGVLAFGAAAGVNASANAEQANSLLLSARNEPIPDPAVTPTINAIHQNAKTYGLIANISFIAGGVLTATGAGLIAWAIAAKSYGGAKTAAKPSPRRNALAAQAAPVSGSSTFSTPRVSLDVDVN